MKRPFVGIDSFDRATLQTAISTAFKPGEQRKVLDVCRGRVKGTGWIEGNVYDTGTVTDGNWAFIFMDKMGYRLNIVLSESISEQFNLPDLVGATVRLSLNGLVLEDLTRHSSSKSLLNKTFAWRNGVVLHVKPKRGEEAFIDTCDLLAVNPSNTGDFVTKRSKQTPSPSDFPQPNPGISASVVLAVSDEMTMTKEATVAKCIVETVTESLEPPGTDPRNPQSLPSPPPETYTSKGLDEHGTKVEIVQCKDDTSRRSGAPMSPALTDTSANRTAATPSHTIRLPEDLNPPQGATLTASCHEATTGTRSLKEDKTVRNRIRREKKHRKMAARVGRETQPENAMQNINGDSDEDYWDTADNEIPYHLLPDDAEQEKTKTSGELRLPAKTVELALLQTAAQKLQPQPQHEAPSKASNAAEDAIPESESTSLSQASAEDLDPAESLRVGCVTTFATYTRLIEFGGLAPQHIMGIAHSPGTISQTKTGEFMMRIFLFDPSNYATNNGLSVSLFEKIEIALPKPEAGDVLLLRDISGDTYSDGKCAIGPSYKAWQWAVFHVKTGMFSNPSNPSSARRQFRPEKTEMQYCIRFSDWWRDISSSTVSFGDETSAAITTANGRPHKLISEADSEGYFDCTVEVLHGSLSATFNDIYTLYVTDYTRNPFVTPLQAAWCPPKLAEVVLQVELSDDCLALGPTMQRGEFYSIRNIRLKVGGGGYLEGRVREAKKIRKLNEDELENQPRLIELLKRKKQWESSAMTISVPEFPHQLFEEITENHHFNCTVEVVHITAKDEYSYLYVTDYTARSDLVPVSVTIASEDFANRVVRISLNDAQVDTARNLTVGDLIAIRNLRLRPSGGSSLLAGRLGGDQRLITKLNPKVSGNAELRALLRRKEEFEAVRLSPPKRNKKGRAARQMAGASETAEVNEPRASSSKSTAGLKNKSEKSDGYLLISDVKASNKCPAVFRLRARVVDFFPDDLRDCTVLRCTSCNQTIPKTRRRCTQCDDVMEDETFVQGFFQVYFRIEDEEGATLDVSVSDERCSVLQDLVPDDVYEDDEAFITLVARVKPLLGDMLNVHDSEAVRRRVTEDDNDVNAPLLDLTIGSWLPEGEPDVAESRAYIILKHSIMV